MIKKHLQKKFFSRKIIFAALAFALFVPFLAEAITIQPPVKWTNLNDLINQLINFVFYVAVVVLPAVIMYGGFLFITAKDNPKQVENAQQMMLFAGIGFLIMLLAKGAVALINSMFLT